MSYILLASYKNPPAAQAATILRNHGHTVIEVDDGLEAWELIEQRQELPSVLFAHLILPNIDGAELFIRFHDRYPHAPTKLMLGVHMEAGGEPFRNWKLFIDNYIMRTYSAWQLILSIEQLLYKTVVWNKDQSEAEQQETNVT